MEERLRESFHRLFQQARGSGGFEFIHALVRTSTYDCRPIEDAFLKIKRNLQIRSNELGPKEAIEQYCQLATEPVPLDTVANLLRCERGEPYRIFPFAITDRELVSRQAEANAGDLARQLNAAGHTELAEVIVRAYDKHALHTCEHGEGGQQEAELTIQALDALRAFLICLIEVYESERASFRDIPRYHRYALGVVEFLVNDDFGLYGWRLHRPHRATSHFERFADGMDGSNYMFNKDTEINYWATQLEPPGGIWTIDGKRLHELSLDGRYNPLGDWQPILYPAWPQDLDALLNDAVDASTDADVVGSLFYIYTTGYRIIEFVVRTNIDLPYEMGTVGDKIHLWKCPVSESQDDGAGERIYDGWVQLDSVDPEHVRAAIAAVGVMINRLAFAYNANIAWRVKYRLVPSSEPLAKPSPEDMEIFNKLLVDFPKGNDAIVLEASLDWYRHARSQVNPFSAFFGYYVAIERVAVAVYDGNATFGLGHKKLSKGERRDEQAECIRQKYEELYSTDPQRFVREAYFDCIISLAKKVRQIAELVFGGCDPAVSALFEKVDGYSLSDIRSGIAHGSLSQVDRDDLELVAVRLPAMASVAKEFLARLCFGKKAGENLPDWSREYVDVRPHSDPRTFIATADVEFVLRGSWTIRPQWCDS